MFLKSFNKLRGGKVQIPGVAPGLRPRGAFRGLNLRDAATTNKQTPKVVLCGFFRSLACKKTFNYELYPRPSSL